MFMFAIMAAELLRSNREHTSLEVSDSYSGLCKVLLKQEKISSEYRKYAIDILGSDAEQESYFMEYEMYDDLVRFYAKQQRYQDQFFLLVKLCRLEEAFCLWFEHQSLKPAADIPEGVVMHVLDYLCAEQRMRPVTQPKILTVLEKSDNILRPSIAHKAQDWIAASQIYTDSLTSLREVNLRSMELKTLLCVQVSRYLLAHLRQSQKY